MYQCRNCGLPQYGRNDRKSRECVKCSFINDLTDRRRLKVLFESDSVKEAFEAVAHAKMNRDVFPQLLRTHTRRHTQFVRRVNK